MKNRGRDNPRNAGGVGLDFYTLIRLAIVGAIAGVIVSAQVGAWVEHLLGGGLAVSWNPFATLGELIAGKRDWSSSATLIVMAFWSGVAAIGVAGWTAIKKLSTPATRVDTAAKYLASDRDVESFSRQVAEQSAYKWLPEGMARECPGLMFGRIPGTEKQLFSTWEDLYLVIFGPRMGKTTSQVIPAIVDAPGNVITTSNKRDIVDDTIRVTATRGRAWVFDPQGIATGATSDRWFFDPLDMVRRREETMDSAALRLADIFKTAARGSGNDGDAFFSEGGKELLARLFLAAAIAHRPIGDVYLWVTDESDRTPVTILENHPEWSQQASALRATYQITEKTRSGLFSQAAQMASILGRREALQWVTPSGHAQRFDPEAFACSTGQNTLYLLSKEGADNAAALTTALVAAVMTAAEAYGERSQGGRLPVPLVAALDEAANTVRWPELPALYSHYGSRGIILMTILQSYAQGVEVWGDNGMELLWSAASIVLYGGGVRDEKILSKLEALIGDVEVFETSTSRTGEGDRTVSRNRRERKILTIAELASLDQWRGVVLAAKRRPLIAEMVPWWARPWPAKITCNLGKEHTKAITQ